MRPIGRLWQQAVRSARRRRRDLHRDCDDTSVPPIPRRCPKRSATSCSGGRSRTIRNCNHSASKPSWRAAISAARGAALATRPTMVRVAIESQFYTGPNRTLVAEIPGRTRPHERIVMAAHIQEPGANDDASGCATLFGIAKAIAEAVARGALPPPGANAHVSLGRRDRGSRQWITSRPQEAQGVQYMFSMDMTGEDTRKTGGTFLIEKEPDPTAVWERPSDPAQRMGRRAGQARDLERQPAQRPAHRRREPAGARYRLGRPDQSLRGRQ